MIRKLFLSIALLPLTVSAADYRLTSPDGGIVLEVACGDSLTYRVEAAGEIVFTPSPLAMTFTDGTVWGVQPKVVKKNYSESDSLIPSPALPQKLRPGPLQTTDADLPRRLRRRFPGL